MLGNWLMLSPTDTGHPLFKLNMRRRRWWQKGYRPLSYGVEIIAWTVMVLLIAWVLFIAGRYVVMVINYGSSLGSPTYRVTRDTWTVLLWSGAISIGLSYLLDFVLMAITVNSINGERSAHRWDLIQLTPLSGQSVLESMHMSNQFRLWRMAMIVVGTRIAVGVAIVLQGLFVSPILEDNTLRYVWSNLWDYPVQSMYLVLLCLIIGVVAITEPLWRLRATSALAMGISAQMQRLITAMSVALPLLLGVWIFMLAVAAGGIWLMVKTVDSIYDWFPGYSDSEEMIAILVIVAFFAAEAAFIYYSFRGIQRSGLRWTMRRAIIPPEQWQVPSVAATLPWWNGLRWWLPHSSVWQENPIFDLNVRGLRWWRSVDSPRQRMFNIAAWVILVLMVLYTAGFAFLAFWHDVSWMPLARAEVLRFATGGVAVVGGVLLVALDILVSAATARTITTLRVPVRDDLLRMTHLTPPQLIAGVRALARLRSWSSLVRFLTFAITAVVLYFSVHFAEWFIRDSIRTFSSWTFDFVADDLGWLIVLILSIVLVTFVKARMVAALTIALAMRFSGMMLELARAAMLVILVLIQMFVIALVALEYPYISPEWGVVLGATVLVLLAMAAVEQAALAAARSFYRRAR